MNYVDSKVIRRDIAIIENLDGGAMYIADQASPLSVADLQFPYLGIGEAKHQARPGPKAHGQAKRLSREEFQQVISFIEHEREFPEADIIKFALSYFAGMRAKEISGLTISDVTNADGSIADFIRIRPGEGKGKRGRQIPMHPAVKDAIEAFRTVYPDWEWLAVSQVGPRVRHQNTHAVTVWFKDMYKRCGLKGCSSHSGRRTFITQLCRNLPRGCSIRDVQLIVGHKRLDTTQAYIEASPNQHEAVAAMSEYLLQSDGSGVLE